MSLPDNVSGCFLSDFCKSDLFRIQFKMNPQLKVPTIFGFALLTGLLSSCGTQPEITTNLNEAAKYVISVNLTSADTVALLEQRYQGRVNAFHPEAGFAIVSTNQAAQGYAVRSVSDNIDALENPEESAEALGISTWASGAGTWASGAGTWASGWSVLDGGSTVPSVPSQNSDMFKRIGLPQAHAIAKNFGAGIKVAVIDTGLDLSHPALINNLAPSSEWRDYVDNDTLPNDEPGINLTPGKAYGHGTAVSGIILQIAPKVTILPLRVLDSKGKGNLDNVVKAIDYAILNGVQVINLSLGSLKSNISLNQEIAYAKTKGVYVIAAAGNNGKNADYPAKDSSQDQMSGFLFGIGSIDDKEAISSFSARGEGVYAFAPGEKIYTLYPSNRVTYATGTSFATPLVSGAFALAMSELSNVADRPQLGTAFGGSLEGDRIWKELYANNPTAIWAHGNGGLEIQRFLLKLPKFAMPNTQINLLRNGNFEDSLNSDWNLTNSSIVSSEFKSGSRALMINSAVDQNATSTLSGLLPNTTYTYMAWVKTAATNRYVCIGVYDFTNDSLLGGLSHNCTYNPSKYTLVSTRFTTDAKHTNAIVYADFERSTAGNAYVDDAMVFATR
jgi:subtilisin family serine protease